MSTRAAAIRNLVIVVALAAVIWAVPAGGQAANLVGSALGVVFALGLGLFGGRMYLEHRTTLYGLDDRYRALFYGTLAVIYLTLTATPRLWASSAGKFAWVALLIAAAFSLVTVYRLVRRY